MGAHDFTDVGFGADMQEAYDDATRAAQHEHGHDPYNGTISTTDGAIEIGVPKGFTADDLLTVMYEVQDGGHDRPSLLDAVPPVRRKFSSEGDRVMYRKDREFAVKWSKLDTASARELRRAFGQVSKWGYCVGFEVPAAEQRRLRESYRAKGRRGRYFRFVGIAAE